MFSRANRQLHQVAWKLGSEPWVYDPDVPVGDLIPCESGDTQLESDLVWQETKTRDLQPTAAPVSDGLFEVVGGEIKPL